MRIGKHVILIPFFVLGCGGSSGKPQAPDTLRSFESNSEGLSEAPGLPDWAKAATILNDAHTAWSTLKATVVAQGAPAATVSGIDAALAAADSDVPAMKARETESDGNSISRLVPDLFDLYTFATPSDALRLDAHIRRLQIDASFADWTACAADMGPIQSDWTRLKPVLMPQAAKRADIMGSQTVVSDLDTNVSTMQTMIGAHDAAGLATQTKTGLDLVDVAEHVF
jgi:hypothetical protein